MIMNRKMFFYFIVFLCGVVVAVTLRSCYEAKTTVTQAESGQILAIDGAREDSIVRAAAFENALNERRIAIRDGSRIRAARWTRVIDSIHQVRKRLDYKHSE